MSIPAGLSGTAAGPVLADGGNTVSSPTVLDLLVALRGLEAVNVCTGHVGGELCTLTEGALDAVPARLRGEVHLRGKRGGNANGAVLLCRNFTVFADQRRVKGGGESQRLRPPGYRCTGTLIEFAAIIRAMTGIGTHIQRNG